MNKREAAIVTGYTGFLIGDFTEFHQLAEKLIGRPIFTGELADKQFMSELQRLFSPLFIELSNSVIDGE